MCVFSERIPTNITELIESLSAVIVDADVSVLVRREHVLADAIRSIKHKGFPFHHCLRV